MTQKHIYSITAVYLVPSPSEEEVEVTIRFNHTPGSEDYYNKSAGCWEQGWGDEVEFASLSVPEELDQRGDFALILAIEKWAEEYLESDPGRQQALDEVMAEFERNMPDDH